MRRPRHSAVWAVLVPVLTLGCGDDGLVMEPSSSSHEASSSASGTVTTDEGTRGSTGSSSSGSTSGVVEGTSTTTADGSSTGPTGEGSSTGEALCEAPGVVVPCDGLAAAPDPFQAIGLGCPGAPDQAIPLESASFHSADGQAWQVATHYGTHIDPRTGLPMWSPTHGEQLLLISSGFVAAPDVAGVVTMASLDQDANENPDDKPLPAPINPVPGSGGVPFMGCDGVGDCSDTLWSQWLAGGSAAHDLLWFQLQTEVPGGTHGFELDFAFFSEEFPESVGTTFNDMFVVWSSSETYVGNLCLVDEQPCTVSGLWPVAYEELDAALEGTGFSAQPSGGGGGTGWYTIKGSAAPHELLEVTFALFDMGDEELDTLVLLDRFAWDCEGCTPTPENPCGVVRPR